MSTGVATPVTFVRADVHGRRSTLRIAGGRIAAIGEEPAAGDCVVDVRGDRMLPGLINAHDHLQLNSLPQPLPSGARYANARQWIAEVDAEKRAAGPFGAAVALSRGERLLIGAVKNLLSGVTTVQHHDPLYPELVAPGFPVHVPASYGWSHSLYIDGEERVRAAHHATPASWPWIIHAAEGVDEEARSELDRLESLGCLTGNTRIVHGIALGPHQCRRLLCVGAGLIWCPSSNLHLFGVTAQAGELVEHGRVALGTDSRLSGTRDLLDELRVARNISGLDEDTLERLVTVDAGRLLGLTDRGRLEPGAAADLIVIPAGAELSRQTRADLRLVMVGGVALYGDRDYLEQLGAPGRAVRVDGRPKYLDARLCASLAAAAVREEGLEFTPSRSEAA
jgi:cytosine/adenosine deaminase-related metal-dependent hydrolase